MSEIKPKTFLGNCRVCDIRMYIDENGLCASCISEYESPLRARVATLEAENERMLAVNDAGKDAKSRWRDKRLDEARATIEAVRDYVTGRDQYSPVGKGVLAILDRAALAQTPGGDEHPMAALDRLMTVDRPDHQVKLTGVTADEEPTK